MYLLEVLDLASFLFRLGPVVDLVSLLEEFLMHQRTDSVLVVFPTQDLLQSLVTLFHLLRPYHLPRQTLESEGVRLADSLHEWLLQFFLEVVRLFLIKSSCIP